MNAQYLRHSGDDMFVCDCARVSFNKTADKFTPEENQKLIRYLAKHNHWSPFAHCWISLRCKAPMFVKNQLIKHQVGFAWNEESRRYVDYTPEFYLPDEWRLRAENIKQGSSEEVLFGLDEDYVSRELDKITLNAEDSYNSLLKMGVCPEQARMVLPQNTYVNWIWSGTLYAWARMYNLRSDSHSQKETQEFAKMASSIMEPLFPLSWKELTCKS